MRKGNPEALSASLQAEVKALRRISDNPIDTEEMPEVKDWSLAERGRFYRPIKRPLSLRLDADMVDWFQNQGQGYQTRMNQILRTYYEAHRDSF